MLDLVSELYFSVTEEEIEDTQSICTEVVSTFPLGCCSY